MECKCNSVFVLMKSLIDIELPILEYLTFFMLISIVTYIWC